MKMMTEHKINEWLNASVKVRDRLLRIERTGKLTPKQSKDLLKVMARIKTLRRVLVPTAIDNDD